MTPFLILYSKDGIVPIKTTPACNSLATASINIQIAKEALSLVTFLSFSTIMVEI